MTFPATQSIPTIPVPNVELAYEGCVQEGQNQQGPWAMKKYLVNWNDRFTFAQAMAGSITRSGGNATTGATIRAIPYPYPANPIMYAKELMIEPAGQYRPGITPVAYQYAICTVNFGSLSWDALPTDDPFNLNTLGTTPEEIQSLQYATQELSFGYEVYELPNSSISWTGAPISKVTSNLGRKVPSITMSITFNHFPLIPMGYLGPLVGTVNNATFLGCSAQTVFLEGVETTREQSFSSNISSGAYQSNITQKVRLIFRFRGLSQLILGTPVPVTWNMFLRPDSLVWDTVQDPNGNFVYQQSDFGSLLSFFSGTPINSFG